MRFYPDSASLTEAGSGAAGGGQASGGTSGGGGGKQPGGGGGAQPSIFSSGAGMPAVNAGEIMLSRAESAALAALETEPDEKHGMRRAKAESGLTDNQIAMLQRRSKHALSKGITLRGQGFIRKPTGGPPEEHSLLRTAKKETAETMEALRAQHRAAPYTLPEESDWKRPVPHSQGEADGLDSVRTLSHSVLPRRKSATSEAEETNAQSTLAALSMASRKMRARRRA